MSVLHPEAAPKLIMPFEIKRDVIEGLGVDELVVIPFDRELLDHPAGGLLQPASWSSTLGAERVSVGENFRFGAKAKGDPEMLASRDEFESGWCRWSRWTARSSPRPGSARWSRPGEVESATSCLGAPFLLEGTVVEGDGRGRDARLPDRQPGARRTTWSARARGLRRVRQRPAGGGQRRRAAHLRDGARAARSRPI